ncbi:MAG: hypothetical protein M3R29_02880 [Verrucomicrobiota bacterium]|nr:hypothetical protein [Verrucomicrobiota bacterium]
MKTLQPNRLVKSTLLLLCCSFAFAASSAWATLVTWSLNPTGVNANVGSSSADFTVGIYTITARGYDSPSTPHELYFKNLGAGERGLGLVGTVNNELQVNPLNFIQLDLTSILALGFTNGQISVGSVQSGESFSLYGSNTLGLLGTKLNVTPYGSTFDEQLISVPSFGTYKFISVVAAAVDVLPVMFQATIVPIPEAASVIPVLCLVVAATALEIRRRRAMV